GSGGVVRGGPGGVGWLHELFPEDRHQARRARAPCYRQLPEYRGRTKRCRSRARPPLGARSACADFPSPPANAGVCPCSRQLRGRAQPWGPLSERPTFRQPRNRATSRARPDWLPDRPDRSRRPVRERSYPALLCSPPTTRFAPDIRVQTAKINPEPRVVVPSSSADKFAHDLGGIIHHRDYPRVIEPRRANHAEYADDTAGAITVGRDDGGGSREREQ